MDIYIAMLGLVPQYSSVEEKGGTSQGSHHCTLPETMEFAGAAG
jgi:hypothetical protein